MQYSPGGIGPGRPNLGSRFASRCSTPGTTGRGHLPATACQQSIKAGLSHHLSAFEAIPKIALLVRAVFVPEGYGDSERQID